MGLRSATWSDGPAWLRSGGGGCVAGGDLGGVLADGLRFDVGVPGVLEFTGSALAADHGAPRHQRHGAHVLHRYPSRHSVRRSPPRLPTSGCSTSCRVRGIWPPSQTRHCAPRCGSGWTPSSAGSTAVRVGDQRSHSAVLAVPSAPGPRTRRRRRSASPRRHGVHVRQPLGLAPLLFAVIHRPDEGPYRGFCEDGHQTAPGTARNTRYGNPRATRDGTTSTSPTSWRPSGLRPRHRSSPGAKPRFQVIDGMLVDTKNRPDRR